MKQIKVYADIIEESALEQLKRISNHPAFLNSKIRIMPDVHAGKGCVIGFTSTVQDKIIPNVVGVDIGCGMMGFNLGNREIDFKQLDRHIKQQIPSGLAVRSKEFKSFPFEDLQCFHALENIDRLKKSLGTLGGGELIATIQINSL